MSAAASSSGGFDDSDFPASFGFFLEESDMGHLEGFLRDVSNDNILELRRMVLQNSSSTLFSQLNARQYNLLQDYFSANSSPASLGDVGGFDAPPRSSTFGESGGFDVPPGDSGFGHIDGGFDAPPGDSSFGHVDGDFNDPSSSSTLDDDFGSSWWDDEFSPSSGGAPRDEPQEVTDVRSPLFRGVFLDTHVHGSLSDVGGDMRQTLQAMRRYFKRLFAEDREVGKFFDDAVAQMNSILNINYFDSDALREGVRRLIVEPLRAGRVISFPHAAGKHLMFVVANPLDGTFALLNTGNGIEYHYSAPTSIKCKYQIPHVYELSLDVDFWTCLLRTTHEWEMANNKRAFRASRVETLYEIVLPMLGLPRRIKGCDWSPQYSGTCFYKAIKAALRYTLRRPSDEWKRMIFRFRKAVLESVDWAGAYETSDVKVVRVAFQRLSNAATKLRKGGAASEDFLGLELLREKVQSLRAKDGAEPPTGVQLGDVDDVLRHRPSELDVADSKIYSPTYPEFVSLRYCSEIVRACVKGRTVLPSAAARLWSACAAIVDQLQFYTLNDLCAVAQYFFIAYATMPAPPSDLRFETLVYLKRTLAHVEEMHDWRCLTDFRTEGISSNPKIVRMHFELSSPRADPIFAFSEDPRAMMLEEGVRFYAFCSEMMGLDADARDQIQKNLQSRDVPETLGQILEIVHLCQFVARHEAPARAFDEIQNWGTEEGTLPLMWTVDKNFEFRNQWLQSGRADRAPRLAPKLGYNERRAYKARHYDRCMALWSDDDSMYAKIFTDKEELADFLVSMEGGPLTALHFFLPRARQDFLKYPAVQKAVERAVFYVPDLSLQALEDDGSETSFETQVRYLSSHWKTTPLLTLSNCKPLFVGVLQELQPPNTKAAFFCAALACRVAQMLNISISDPAHPKAATYVQALKGSWRDRVEVLLQFNYQKKTERSARCGLARPDVRALLCEHFVGQGALRDALRRELSADGVFKLASRELSAWLNHVTGLNSDAPWVPRGFACPLTVETHHPPLCGEKVEVELRGRVYLYFDRRCGVQDPVQVNDVAYLQAFPETGRAYDGVKLTYRCSELRDQYGLRFAMFRDTDRSEIPSWSTHYGLLNNGHHWVDLASATSSVAKPKTSLEHAKLRALFHEVEEERLVLENSKCSVFECKLQGRQCVVKMWRARRSAKEVESELRYVEGGFGVTFSYRRWGNQYHKYVVRSSDARMLRVGEYENKREEPFSNSIDAIDNYTNFELEREFEGGDFMPYGGRETKLPEWLLNGLVPAPLQKTHEFWLVYGGPIVGHPVEPGRYYVVIDSEGVRKTSTRGEETKLVNHDLDRLEWEDGVVEHVASALVFSKRRPWKSLRYVGESRLVPRSFAMRDEAVGKDYVLAPLYLFRHPKPEGRPFPSEYAVDEGLPAYALYENNGAFLVADSRLALIYLAYTHVLRYEYAAAISHVLRIPQNEELDDVEKVLLRGMLREEEMDLQPDGCAFYVALSNKFSSLKVPRKESIAHLYTVLHDSVTEECRLPAEDEGDLNGTRRVYWNIPDASFEMEKRRPSFPWRRIVQGEAPHPSVGAQVPKFDDMQRKDFDSQKSVYAEHAARPDVNFFLKLVAVFGRAGHERDAMNASLILQTLEDTTQTEPWWEAKVRRLPVLKCRTPVDYAEPVDLSSDLRFMELYRNPKATPEVRAEFEDRLRRLPVDRLPLFFNLREEAIWIAVLGTALLPAAQGSGRGSSSVNYKELLFEFQMGIFLRPEQREYLETALVEPNVVTQMLMGFGKSAVITPLLCLRVQDLGMTPVVVVPSFLVQQTRSTLFKAFAQGIVRPVNFLHYRRDAARPAFDENQILCGDPQTFQSMYLDAVRGKKIDKYYLYWKGIEKMRALRVRGWAILDEVDYTLNPISSELNHAVGNARGFDSWRWELAHSFAELAATPAKYPLWERALRDLGTRVINYPHPVVVREGVYEGFLRAIAAQAVPYRAVYEREVYGQWLDVVLPHCLGKIHQVDFGLRDNFQFAVPYVAKGKPSPNSEFSHPDVIVYFTSLAYMLDGLRSVDVAELVRWMQLRASRERGDYDARPTAATFAAWAGQSLREVETSNLSPSVAALARDPRVVDYYLRRFLYPRKLRSAAKKIVSTGSDFTQVFFSRVTAFTGTPSVVPPPLRSLRSESANAEVEAAVAGLDFRKFSLASPLDVVSRAVALDVDALIDVGALLVGMSNLDVAKALTGRERECAFFDDRDVLVVWDGRQLRERAKVDDTTVIYYDQAHTTGVHVDLKADARGLITVGVGTPYTRFTQALYRLRKISTTQSAMVLVPRYLGDIEDVGALKGWMKNNDELQNRKKERQLDVHQRSIPLHVESYDSVMGNGHILRSEYEDLIVNETYDVDVLVTTENLREQEQEREQERQTQRETNVGGRKLQYGLWTFKDAVRVPGLGPSYLRSPVGWARHPYVLLYQGFQCAISATEAHVIMQLKPSVSKLVLRAFPFFDIVAGESCGYPKLCGYYNITEDNTYALIDQKNFPELAATLEVEERLENFTLDRSVVESRSYNESVGARSLATLYPAGVSALTLAKHMGALFVLDMTLPVASARRQKRPLARSYHSYKPMEFTERRGVMHTWGLKMHTVGETFVPTDQNPLSYYICKAPTSLSYVWDAEFALPSMAGLDMRVERDEPSHRVRVNGFKLATYGWRQEGTLRRNSSKGLLIRGDGVLERVSAKHDFEYQFLVVRDRGDFVLRDGENLRDSQVCFRASLAKRKLPIRVGIFVLGGQTVVSFDGVIEHLPFLSAGSLLTPPNAESVPAAQNEAADILKTMYPQIPLDRFTLENLPFRILDQEMGVKCGNAALCVKNSVSVVWYGEEPCYAIPYVPGVKSYVIDHLTVRKITEPVRVQGHAKFTLRWRALLIFVRSA